MKIIHAVIIAVLLVGVVVHPVRAVTQNYLDHEAGMAAYFHFTEPVNLKSNLLRNLFRTIQTDRQNFLIGFIPVQGFESYPSQDIKVFIHNSGWVVGYLLGDDVPSSRILNQSVTSISRLDLTIQKVAEAIGITGYQTAYFNFRYPTAAHLLVIQEDVPGSKTKTFDFRLPGQNVYYERAWYACAPGLFSSINYVLDGKPVQRVTSALAWAAIDAGSLVTDAKHMVSLQGGLTGGIFGLTILYSGDGSFTINYADSILDIPLQPIPQGLGDAAAEVAVYYPTYLPSLVR